LNAGGHFQEAFHLRARCLLRHKHTKTRTFRPGYGEFDRRIYTEHHCYLCTPALHNGWRPSPQWQRGIERKSFRRWFRREIEFLTEFGGRFGSADIDWEEALLNSSAQFELRARLVRRVRAEEPWRRFL